MKTILVPVDFSSAANNAARYAVQFAKKMQYGVKLCHVVALPADPVLFGQVAWSINDNSSRQKQTNRELRSFAEKLTREEIAVAEPLSAHPMITYGSDIGTVPDTITKQADEHHIPLVIMGMSGGVGLSKLFMGSQSRETIEVARCPVLLIPHHSTYKKISRIAFATDLNRGDISLINAVSSIARVFDAEVLIVHIAIDGTDKVLRQSEVDNFLTEVSAKVDYPRVYYRQIKDIGIDKGLEWLSGNNTIDILAMSHNHRNFFEKLVKNSHTRTLAKRTPIPLMVFPRQ